MRGGQRKMISLTDLGNVDVLLLLLLCLSVFSLFFYTCYFYFTDPIRLTAVFSGCFSLTLVSLRAANSPQKMFSLTFHPLHPNQRVLD